MLASITHYTITEATRQDMKDMRYALECMIQPEASHHESTKDRMRILYNVITNALRAGPKPAIAEPSKPKPSSVLKTSRIDTYLDGKS